MTRPSDHAFRWGCRCGSCEHDRYRRRKQSWMRSRREGPIHVDVTPARDRIRELLDVGFTVCSLAPAFGLDPAGVRFIAAGRTSVTDRRVVEQAQSLTFADIIAAAPARSTVPSAGAGRRLRGLSRMGWPTSVVAAVGDLTEVTVHRVRVQTRVGVTAKIHRRVTAVAAELGGRVGPDVLLTRAGEVKGWQSLYAWDDDVIDDPRGQPYTADHPDAQREAFIDNVVFLLAVGESPEAIAARLVGSDGRPMRVDAVAQRLKRYERPDLARPFHAATQVVRRSATV